MIKPIVAYKMLWTLAALSLSHVASERASANISPLVEIVTHSFTGGHAFADKAKLKDKPGGKCLQANPVTPNLPIVIATSGVWQPCSDLSRSALIVAADGVTLQNISVFRCRDEFIRVRPSVRKLKIRGGKFVNCGSSYSEKDTSHYKSATLHALGGTQIEVSRSTFIGTRSFQILRIDGKANDIQFINNTVLRTAYRVVSLGTGSTGNSITIAGNDISFVGFLATGSGVGATAIYNDGEGVQRVSQITRNRIRMVVENAIEGAWSLIDHNSIVGAGSITGNHGRKFTTPSRAAISTRGPARVIGNEITKSYRGINIYAPGGALGDITLDRNVISPSPGCKVFVRQVPVTKSITVDGKVLHALLPGRLDACIN